MEHTAPERAIKGVVMLQRRMLDIQMSFRTWSFRPSRMNVEQLDSFMIETDVIIIGAGHNGLTCAAYLAMAGLRVRVVERRKVVGGAAVTEEFHPGFRNSVAAYTVSLLNPQVARDLKLAEQGPAGRRAARAEFPARARRELSPHRRRTDEGVRRTAERP
ncbi:phytoene dehydrogenase-like protein [Bradyrhizobium sp. LM3.2]